MISEVLPCFKMKVEEKKKNYSHLSPFCSAFLPRQAEFYQNPRGPDWHLGRGCIVCVPVHRRAEAEDHLDEEGQESQLPALRGG